MGGITIRGTTMSSSFRNFVIISLVVLLSISGVSGFVAFQTSNDLKDSLQEISGLTTQLSSARDAISDLQGQLGSLKNNSATLNQQAAKLIKNTTAIQDASAMVLPSMVYIETYSSSGVASGSGVIMDENGYILTNKHVVNGITFVPQKFLYFMPIFIHGEVKGYRF
jgi:S1-C subfamily serine protease